MTFNTELRKMMLAIGADAVIKKTTLTKPHSRGADDEREEESSAAYPFRHAREYGALSRSDPKQWPPRLPPAKVSDGNVALRRGSERAKSLAKSRTGLSAPQITAQSLYDETMWGDRVTLGAGCRVLIVAWDKAQPRIKWEEGQTRKAAGEAAEAKRKAADEAGRAAKRLRLGEDGASADAPAQPRVDDVERNGYIPASAYTADGSDMTFRDGYLIRYATTDDDGGESDGEPRIVNATLEFDFSALMNIPKLRKELVQWICKTIALEESKRWPDVRFCIDHARGVPPTCWRNGKRLPDELGSFTTGHYFEGDHAVGAWTAALLREKRDVVVWTVDGDLMLVCLWAIFNMRYTVRHTKAALDAIRIDPADVKAHTAYWRDLGADVANAGYSSQPVAAHFGDEPRLILVLQGNGAGATVLLDMNVMCTRFCNAFMSPSHWCILALLLKNDYVKHGEIANRIGVKTLMSDFAARISPVANVDPKEVQARIKNALWIFSRTWAKAPDFEGNKQRHSAVTQGHMFDTAVKAMAITTVGAVTPRVATRCIEALWRWRRCSRLSSSECLPPGSFSKEDELPWLSQSQSQSQSQRSNGSGSGNDPPAAAAAASASSVTPATPAADAVELTFDYREAADEHALAEMMTDDAAT